MADTQRDVPCTGIDAPGAPADHPSEDPDRELRFVVCRSGPSGHMGGLVRLPEKADDGALSSEWPAIPGPEGVR